MRLEIRGPYRAKRGLRRALAAGVPGEKIVFSGVGKTKDEMALALESGIYQFNVESEPELAALNEVAGAKGVQAPVAIRINPDVGAGGHEKISTGKSEDKFGVPWDFARAVYEMAAELPHIAIKGVDVHIGSQITDLNPFEAAFSRVADLVRMLRSDGHAIERLDLGGGLGIPYDSTEEAPPLPKDYAAMVQRVTEPLDVQLIFEPGRMIVGNAGILVAKAIYLKEGAERRFLILDAAMNDLIRPALYDAYHEILPVKEPQGAPMPYDVVGPVCETGDTFARNRNLPPVEAGDLVAFMSAGAYGAVQSSEYNTRPLAPEVLVNGADHAVIRPRPDYEAMINRDRLPPWLAVTQ